MKSTFLAAVVLVSAAFAAFSAESAAEKKSLWQPKPASSDSAAVPLKADQKAAEETPLTDPKTIPNACRGELSCRADEGAAKGNLGSLRAGASIYYGDTEGSYPATLSALVPKYVEKIPAIAVGGHKKTDAVRIVTKAKGKSAGPYVKDTGGWLYFLTPENPNLDGTIVIDCAHGDHKNRPLWGF